MSKTRLFFMTAVIFALIFAGCAGQNNDEIPTAQPTATPTQEPTEPPTEEPTQAPTEPPVLRNPFNGEVVEELPTQRPYAFSINNVRPSMPQHGIGQADIVYEMLVEYGLTRCLAIFDDISDVEKIGSIRSARLYTLRVAQSWDAILVRCGGSTEADRAIANLGWDEIDGYKQNFPFYRDKERRSAGYALEHTMFTSGPDVLQNAADRELRQTREDQSGYGLRFAEDATPDGDSAASIHLTFSKSKSTTMTYDSESGKYLASQYDKDWIDNNSGETLSFENVLVVYAKTWTQENGIHESMDLSGNGTGLYANGGKIVPIRWSKEADTAPFAYCLEDGTPLSVGVGKSYIAIIPQGANVTYE